ncbi:zinc metalloproteinase nas-15 [Trichonephila clavipes]|nr:zinc metalloproteinase nas-15 [Trichonephila clavipes]
MYARTILTQHRLADMFENTERFTDRCSSDGYSCHQVHFRIDRRAINSDSERSMFRRGGDEVDIRELGVSIAIHVHRTLTMSEMRKPYVPILRDHLQRHLSLDAHAFLRNYGSSRCPLPPLQPGVHGHEFKVSHRAEDRSMLSSFKSPPVGMVLKFEQHSSSPLLLDRRPESGPPPIALIVYQNAICYSMVGRMGGEQNLSLATDCDQMGIVIHEFMHALGFWHEQSRIDRDDYVTIRWENISPARSFVILRNDTEYRSEGAACALMVNNETVDVMRACRMT